MALIGVGTSDKAKIFLAPDFVEYRDYFEGSPQRIGTCSIIETLISSLDGLTPGTMYAYFPFIKFLILFIVLGL